MKKIFLYLIMLLMIFHIAYATNQILFIDFNNNAEDEWGGHTVSNTGVTYTTDYAVYNTSGNGTSHAGDFEESETDYFKIDDANDLDFTDGAGNDQPVSFSLWFKQESQASDNHIFSKWDLGGDRNILGNLGDGGDKPAITFTDTDYDYIGQRTDSAIGTGKFHHIVYVYNGNNSDTGISIYVNGSLTASSALSAGTYNGMSANAVDFIVGGYVNGAGYAHTTDGIIDDFKIFNITLNQTEINNLYNYGNIDPASNNVVLTLYNNLTDTQINTFEATINGTYYSTTDGNLEYPQSNSNLPYEIAADGMTNITGYWEVNNSLEVRIMPSIYSTLILTNVTDLQADQIYDNITLYYGVNSISGDLPLSLSVINGTSTIIVEVAGYYNYSTSLTIDYNETLSTTATNFANANISFYGSVSGDPVSVQCTIDGSTLISSGSSYAIPINTNEIYCIAGDSYVPLYYNVTWTGYNISIYNLSMTEYYIYLNFTTNVTGSVTWLNPNDNGKCCQIPEFSNDSGYDAVAFSWIKTLVQFAEDDLVTVRFNNKTNDTVQQYYEFINERDVIISDHVGVLTTLDYSIWANVYNYAGDELYDATIRVMYYPTDEPTDGYVVTQRVTRPYSGTAGPGVLLDLYKNYNYWILITKDGYNPLSTQTQGTDLENNLVWEFTLESSAITDAYDWYLSGNTDFSNESSMTFTVANGDTNSIYYTTSFKQSYTSKTLSSGAGLITLYNNEIYNDGDYTSGQDFTLNLYEYNSTLSTYVNMKNITVSYVPKGTNDAFSEVVQDNNVLAGLYWVVLILCSSILGQLIQINNEGTGYYIFGIGTILLGIFYIKFLPVAAIIGLGTLARNILNTTQD